MKLTRLHVVVIIINYSQLLLFTKMATKRLRQASLSEFSKKKKATETPDNSGTIDDEDETLVSTSCIVQCEEEQLTLLDSNQLQEAELNTEVPSESECCTDESLEQASAVLQCQSVCCTNECRPYQPTNKHILASMANGNRNFMSRWYDTFNWLTLCTTKRRVFCFYCRIAEQRGILSFSTKAKPNFTITGFNNWRKALAKFKNHSACNAHAEAVMKW